MGIDTHYLALSSEETWGFYKWDYNVEYEARKKADAADKGEEDLEFNPQIQRDEQGRQSARKFVRNKARERNKKVSEDAAVQYELDYLKDREDRLQEDFKHKEKVASSDINSLFLAFLNRSRFIYSIYDIVNYGLRCLCLRELSS